MNPDDAFERCLELLYDAALDDTRWSAATGLIEEALDAAGNALSVVEGGGRRRTHPFRPLSPSR